MRPNKSRFCWVTLSPIPFMSFVSLWWPNKPQNFYKDLSRNVNHHFHVSPSDLLGVLWTYTTVGMATADKEGSDREISWYFMLPKLLRCHVPLNWYIYYVRASVCIRMRVGMRNGASVDIRINNLGELGLSFHDVGHGTQTIRLGCKCLHPRGHLTGSIKILWTTCSVIVETKVISET